MNITITFRHMDGTDAAKRFAQEKVAKLQKFLRQAMNHPPFLAGTHNTSLVADLATAFELTRQGRLRLVDGRVPEVLPGLCLEPTFDTHTYGHQHVVVDNEHDGAWVLPGDAVYTYANLEGVDGDGRYVPIGFATGSQQKCIFAMHQMMQAVGGRSSRIVPGHEVLLWARGADDVRGVNERHRHPRALPDLVSRHPEHPYALPRVNTADAVLPPGGIPSPDGAARRAHEPPRTGRG